MPAPPVLVRVHIKCTLTSFLQILKKIIDDATKINYQLVKIIVIFFNGYDIRHILSKRSIYFQNNEKQQWVWVISQKYLLEV